MNGKRVFVSGGAGVIGLEMIPRLLERGHTVLTGDLKPRPKSFSRDVIYRQGDLNEMTKEELGDFAPDIFIHLAATFERSDETYGFWEENFWHNVRLSHHLMTIAKDLDSLRRVVFASSYLIYDQSRYQFSEAQAAAVRLNERDPIMPRNLTGMAKLAHEIELSFLQGFRSKSFSSVCARIFRGYGRNSRDVISRWVRDLLAGKGITVYRPEGLFDYVYAKDTAEGLIRLGEADAVTGIINLGTGRARRVQDVVDTLQSHFPGMKVAVEGSTIPFEASEADITMYEKLIGWRPEYDIERAIPEIIAHERARSAAAATNDAAYANVLVTSAARKIPLIQAVKKAARTLNPAIKVIAGDVDAKAPSRHVSDEFWLMPRTVDANIDAVESECMKRNVGVVIPTRDGELQFWARHSDRLAKQGIDVVISPLASVEICVDKLAFWQFGNSHNLPFIPTALSPDELGEGPFVVKQRYGAGSKDIGLKLSRDAALAHGATLDSPIYQPFVGGQEISVDAWMDKSFQPKGIVLRRREQVVDGESRVTTTFRNPALEAQLRHVLETLKLRGHVVLQAFVDEAGAMQVIECNTRFGGASTTSIAAGLDSFYWTLLEANKGDVSLAPFNRVKTEVTQVRIPADIYIYDNDPDIRS